MKRAGMPIIACVLPSPINAVHGIRAKVSNNVASNTVETKTHNCLKSRVKLYTSYHLEFIKRHPKVIREAKKLVKYKGRPY